MRIHAFSSPAKCPYLLCAYHLYDIRIEWLERQAVPNCILEVDLLAAKVTDQPGILGRIPCCPEPLQIYRLYRAYAMGIIVHRFKHRLLVTEV